jgi:hypothetical protein
MHRLALLLPLLAVSVALAGLGFLGNETIVNFARAVTSGAALACLWSLGRIFLLDDLEHSKLRTLAVGAAGGAVFGAIYLAFGSSFLELHELFLTERRRPITIGPPLTEAARTAQIAGAMGAGVALIIDFVRNPKR